MDKEKIEELILMLEELDVNKNDERTLKFVLMYIAEQLRKEVLK